MSMDKYIAKFKNSNIVKVLEVAKPRIEERTEKFIESEFKEFGKYPSAFAIEMYQLRLIYDLVNALSNYIKDSDDLTDFELFTRQGIYVITGVVVRDNVRHYIETEIILAGGYNIQCLHIRYIVKTKLPKISNQNSLASKVKELIKSKNALQRLEEDEQLLQKNFTRNVEEIQSKMIMTDQDIINEKSWLVDMMNRVWEELSVDVQKNFDNSKEEFERRKNNNLNEVLTSHRSYYSQKRIDLLTKEFKKNLTKLEGKRKKLEV